MTDEPERDPDAEADPDRDPAPADQPKRRRKGSIGQSIGGVLFGFEQQVFRNVPPPHELVHKARPDAPVPAGDGGFMTIELPGDGDGSGAHEDDAADAEQLARGRDGEAGREHQRAEDGRPQMHGIDIPDADVDADRGPEPRDAG